MTERGFEGLAAGSIKSGCAFGADASGAAAFGAAAYGAL